MPASSGKTHIYAVLLAAGSSRRFGEDNKLLAEIDGQPLVRRVAERLLQSRVNGVTVVTGFQEDRVRAALAGLDVEFTHNAHFREGLASSLRCGVERLSGDTQGAMIVLADMPGLSCALINKLIENFEREGCKKIVYPAGGDGAQRNPVLWPRRFFGALRKLQGDAGAKSLIAGHAEESVGVPVDDEAAFNDIDAPRDLADWRDENAS